MSKHMGFRRKEWLFLLRWTVATAVGFTVVSPFIVGVIFIVGFSAANGGSLGDLNDLISFTQVGLIIGASIGFGQTLALIGQVKKPILWLPVSIFGGTLGGFLVGLVSLKNRYIALILSATIPVFFLGIAQKVVLMKFLKKANGWIIANIISWALAQVLLIIPIFGNMDLYRILNRIEDGLSFDLFIDLIIIFASVAVIGLITGINLTWLLKNFKKE